MEETYNMAVKTKRAVDEVVAGKSIEEARDIKSDLHIQLVGRVLGEFAIASSEGWYRETMYTTWTKPVRMT